MGSDLVKSFEGHEIVQLDHDHIEVSDHESCQIIIKSKPDIVINTAAFHRTDDCEDDPKKTFLVNTLGAKNISGVCEQIGATVLYISTDYVFNGFGRIPYTEEDCPDPINTYGISSDYK